MLKLQTPDHARVIRRVEGYTSLEGTALPLDGILIRNPVRTQHTDGGQGPAGQLSKSEGLHKAGMLLNLAIGLATLASVLLMLRKRARPPMPFPPPEMFEPEAPSQIGFLNLGKREQG